jgi:hypothetical protein
VSRGFLIGNLDAQRLIIEADNCDVVANQVGRHKHFRMIAVQLLVEDLTGVVIPFEELWERMGGMYDLDELDEMVRYWCE